MAAMSTYAVSWSAAAGARCSGRLGLHRSGVMLTGGSRGNSIEQEIAYDQIDRVELEGGQLRVRKRDGRSLSLRSLDAPGALRELAERLVRAVG